MPRNEDMALTVVSSPLAEVFEDVEKNSYSGLMEVNSPEFERDRSPSADHHLHPNIISLHQAARENNLRVLKQHLTQIGSSSQKSKRIDALDDDEMSPLQIAAKYTNVECMELLLQHGASSQVRGEEEATALHYACRCKPLKSKVTFADDGKGIVAHVTEKVIELLLDNPFSKAVINARDIYGMTPLHHAALRGNVPATRTLLKRTKVDVNATDKQDMTPLHVASSHGHTEVSGMLIEADSNLRAKDEDGTTSLHYACMEGNINIMNLIYEAAVNKGGQRMWKEMMDARDFELSTPLHYAVQNSHLLTATQLVKRGADVNVTRSHFLTPLHLAAQTGNEGLVKLFLGHKARVDAFTDQQQTALHRACIYNNKETVKLLINHGADIERTDDEGFTPLMLAALKGNTETCQELLKNKANISAVDVDDKNAIFWAADENKTDTLEVLLEYDDTIVDEVDKYGNSPLHQAASRGYIDCCKILINYKADLDAKNEEEQTPLHLAASNGKARTVKELIKLDKTIVIDEDENSNTALHLASLAGHKKVVKALIDAGADIEARNVWLWTPLDCAAAKGFEKTALVLLENDSPVDPTDKAKTTPLHLACKYGHVAVVNVLLEWEADVSLRDVDGMNCLDIAIENGKKDAAFAIIASSDWKDALKNVTAKKRRDGTLKQRTTPMRKLIKKMPDVAKEVFNRCTVDNGLSPDHSEYTITFNYEFLEDMYTLPKQKADFQDDASSTSDTWSISNVFNDDNHLVDDAKLYTDDSDELKRNHPLMIMVNSNREQLLSHPLVTLYLRHKWTTYGRYVYYGTLFLFLIYLFFITGYVVIADIPNCDTAGEANSNICLKDNLPAGSLALFHRIGQYVIIVMALFHIGKEVLQLYTEKFAYFTYENLMEWTLYVLAIVYVFPWYPVNPDTASLYPADRSSWQWQCGAISVFLSWIDLILFIRKFPRLGIYVVMFTDILRTFFDFAIVFLLFIVAFALGFYSLLRNQESFQFFGYAMVKTAVMLTGEFEFEALFIDPSSPNQFQTLTIVFFCIFLVVMSIIVSNLLIRFRTVTNSMVKTTVMLIGEFDYEDIFHGDSDVLFYSSSVTLFCVFVVIMSIIVANLLVGLAVDDIKAVQEIAALKRLAMQVDLALQVEHKVPEFLRKKFVVSQEIQMPNRESGILNKVSHTQLSSETLQAALNPEKTELEVLQQNQTVILQSLNNLKSQLKSYSQHQDRIEALISAIAQKENVDEDDVQNIQDHIADDG